MFLIKKRPELRPILSTEHPERIEGCFVSSFDIKMREISPENFAERVFILQYCL